MRIAFIVQRTNYFRYYGALIEAAKTLGCECEVWLYKRESGKAYLEVSEESVPKRLRDLVKVKSCDSAEQFLALIETNPNVIFSLHTRTYYQVPATKTKFITLQHGLDTFLESTPMDLMSSDEVIFYSKYWFDWACSYYAREGYGSKQSIMAQLEPGVRFSGTPQLDVTLKLDDESLKSEFNIPRNKKVVLLLPINLTYWPGEWPKFFAAETKIEQVRRLLQGIIKEGLGFSRYFPWILKDWNDAGLIKSISEFCKRNNAFLIIKGRRKDPFREAVLKYADLALFDEDYYPSTTLKLMKVSDICIHFYSSAVFEAAQCNSFGVCVDRPNLPTSAHALWRRNEEGHVFNYPGVNMWQTMPEFIENFHSMDIEYMKVDAIAQKRFITKFLSRENVSGEILKDVLSSATPVVLNQ